MINIEISARGHLTCKYLPIYLRIWQKKYAKKIIACQATLNIVLF